MTTKEYVMIINHIDKMCEMAEYYFEHNYIDMADGCMQVCNYLRDIITDIATNNIQIRNVDKYEEMKFQEYEEKKVTYV